MKSDFVGVADAQVLVPSADGRSRAHVFTLQKRYKCRRNKDSFDARLEQGKRAVNYTQNWWATEKKKKFIIYLSHRGENEDCGTHTRLALKARITKASMTSSSWFFVHYANDCLSPWEIVPPIEGKWIPSFSDTFFWNINSRWHAKKRFDNKSQLAACFFSRLWISDARKERERKEKTKTNNNRIRIAIESTDFGKRKQQHFQR